MRLPVLRGLIKRRLLVNFRAAPEAIQRLLPSPLRPKLHDGHAIAGICLIRLEEIRPAGLPAMLGLASENAAHRIAVEWPDAAGGTREGVFIPRRDTSSLLNRLAGGRIFPGEHHGAHFSIADDGDRVDLEMKSDDHEAAVHVIGRSANELPTESCFGSLAESSRYFEGGSLGYSATADGCRLDGLRLQTEGWEVRAFAVERVESSFFSDEDKFPPGSIEFDHALVMREVRHEWHQAADLRVTAPQEAAAG